MLRRILMLMLRIRRARRDPDLFVGFCFTDPRGRPLRQGKIHRELQAFLSSERRGLVELPRDHGKSTQVCARLIWELARDTSLRIKIICASEALAVERGRFIREAIVNNSRVKVVFPNLRPARPWSDTRLSVVRPANAIGPSLTSIGVQAASTGSRADILVCDDIVDVKALYSKAERDRVKEHFRNNLMNLLEPDGRFWGLCTPWHRADLNAELKENAAYPVLRRAIDSDLEPIWPERWSKEALEARQREIGSASFARGYRLVPLADEDTVISRECVQYWKADDRHLDRLILSVDPAISTSARADRSAFVVLGQYGNEIRCLYSLARRVNAPGLISLIRKVDSAWNPEVILFESNAAFRGIAELMTAHESFGPKVKQIVNTRDKGARVATFGVSVENGSFRLEARENGEGFDSQNELLDEMITFPLGEHDDLLDAAATGTSYLLGNKEPRAW